MYKKYDSIIKFWEKYTVNYTKAKKDVNKILRQTDYPYMKYFTNIDKIREKFNKLKEFKVHVIHDSYKINNVKLSNDDTKFNGKYYLIIDDPEEYDNIELISDYFNEECRVHCRFITEKMSIYDFYRNKLTSIIEFMEKNSIRITLENMREILWKIGYKQCSTFKPKLEKFIIEMFDAKYVLDISSGWGDRLIGAMASNIILYHGFDPNPCLHKNYKRIIKTFKDLQVNPNAKYIIKKQPFEKAKLNVNFYDLVMTSPPYFNMEVYTDGITINERTWYDNYLIVWMEKCYKSLKQFGIIAININQLKTQYYVYWLLKDMGKLFKYMGVISHSKPNKKNPQPIFIWKKI